jgi:hypothetical protein
VTAICLIDATVLCELLPVPGKSQRHQQVRTDFDQRKAAAHEMFLPFATLIEVGNHVGQVSDANQRRQVSIKFVDIVRKAMDGGQPFEMFRIPERRDVARWLDAFPNWSPVLGAGLGDLSIKIEWERLRSANRKRRVYVWSFDAHLQGLDTASS